MAKKGIKVKDLARELAITSRQLIDRCRAEGIHVQNSITKLDPESERTVRSWFDGVIRSSPQGSRALGLTRRTQHPQPDGALLSDANASTQAS